MDRLADRKEIINKMKMQVKRLNPRAKLPTYGTALSAGADLYVCLEEPVTIQPGQTAFLPTGLAIAVPEEIGRASCRETVFPLV